MPDSSCSSSIPPVVFFKVKKYVSSKSVFPVLPFLYVAFMFLQFGVNWRVHFPEVLSYCYSSKAYYSSNNKTKQNKTGFEYTNPGRYLGCKVVVVEVKIVAIKH